MKPKYPWGAVLLAAICLGVVAYGQMAFKAGQKDT